MNSNKIKIEISSLTILKTIAIIVTVFILYHIWQIVAIVFFALILSSGLDNLIDKLESMKVPRIMSVISIFILLLSSIAIIIILIAQPIKIQLVDLITNFPQYYTKLIEGIAFITDNNELEQSLLSLQSTSQLNTNDLISFISSIFGGLASLLLILVLTFYMSMHEHALKKATHYTLKKKHHKQADALLTKIQEKIGAWLQGQIILSLIVGILVFIGLSLLGIKYALVLAIIAALGEFIPYIGPILASILAMVLALAISPIHVIFVALFFIGLQLVENHLLVPKIMQHAVGLNPIISICAVLIGMKIGGAMGALMALPTAIVILTIIDFFSEKEILN